MTSLGYKLLAAALLGLGIVGLVSGDFASVWQQIPIANLPFRSFFAYAVAVSEIAVGIGLFFRRSRALASRALLVFLLLWAVLLKLPPVIGMPQVEAMWLGLAEVTVMIAGAWVVLIAFTGDRRQPLPFGLFVNAQGLRNARILLALSLWPIGLSHFFYPTETAAFVPRWLPQPVVWGYLTGAADVLAGVAILLGYWPRLAASLVAAMLFIITVLVWTPGLAPAANGVQFQITGFLISATIAAGAWTVADSYRDRPIVRGTGVHPSRGDRDADVLA